MNTIRRLKTTVARAFPCNWCKKKITTTTIQGDNQMGGRFLLVGINSYPGAPLAGCVNDVTDMAHKLTTECGVKEENIRLLTDGRATTSAILERCNWLTQVNPGEPVFFHYSGHGAQVPIRNNSGEIDNLSEVVCPVDFDWTPEHMITDKQFVEIFKKIPSGAKFYWFSDSCHSGDLDRTIPRKDLKTLGIRMFPVPVDIWWRQLIAKKKNLSRAMIGNILDVGFVSGCQSNQTSADADFGGKPNGALTYYLLKRLNMVDPLSMIVSRVVQDLNVAGFSQVPTCSGARKDMLFLG